MRHLKRFDEDIFGSGTLDAIVGYPNSDVIDDEDDEHDKKKKPGYRELDAISSLDSDGEQLIDAYPGPSMYPERATLKQVKL